MDQGQWYHACIFTVTALLLVVANGEQQGEGRGFAPRVLIREPGAAPAFPTAPNVAAGSPSRFWGTNLTKPYPTNTFWMNFVLNNGAGAEQIAPYRVRSRTDTGAGQGGLEVLYPGAPSTADDGMGEAQRMGVDWSVTCAQGVSEHRVLGYDDFSVRLNWGGILDVPLVRGSPYVTLLLRGCTPVFNFSSSITGLVARMSPPRYEVTTASNGRWAIFFSAFPRFRVTGATGNRLICSRNITRGTLRVAWVPPTPGALTALQSYSNVFPIGGSVGIPATGQLIYRWRTLSYRSGGSTNTVPLMLTLPVHRENLLSPPLPPLSAAANVSYASLNGPMEGLAAANWTLQLPSDKGIRWSPPRPVPAADVAEVVAALKADVAAISEGPFPDVYFNGKELARVARLALIAEELGCAPERAAALSSLQKSLSQWLDGGVPGDSFIYDAVWGGVVTSKATADSGAEFGNGVYNDHHYHYGYFVYAAAVVAKGNSAWALSYQPKVYSLVRDYMTWARTDASFPRLRHFDFFAGHSWASGLTEFFDGRNQESSSEAVNAYHAATLLGMVYNDTVLTRVAATLTVLESRGTQELWHVPSSSTMYSPAFKAANKVVGVLWETKRDAGLWWAGPTDLAYRTGIQVMPLTPITEVLFTDPDFLKELVAWTEPGLGAVSDTWKALTYALQAVYDKPGALARVRGLSIVDRGLSRAALLHWIHTRA